MESLELLILKSIIHNREFADMVVPFITKDIFENYSARNIGLLISNTYKNRNGEILTIDLIRSSMEKAYAAGKFSDDKFDEIIAYIDKLSTPYVEQPMETLVAETQDYFRKRMSANQVQELLKCIDSHQNIDIGTIRELEDCANFSFNDSGYYNYMKEFIQRIEDYNKTTKKYPFPLAALNNCTNGGMNSKSLSIAMASTGGGKSIFLCNSASHLIKLGYNVLYITCEMSVEEISKRIDADLLGATQDSLMQHEIETITLKERMNAIPDKDTWGQLYIKEYPAGYANASIIRRDLEEIQRKYETKVDVLVLDYLNLLSSTRYSTKTANTYVVVKAVAEEVRGLGQTFDIPVISATQSNRSALNKEIKIDAGMEAVSDSYGLPQTCDFMFNIISPDEASWKGQHYRLLRILKNRWGDPSWEFIKVKLDTALARFSDVPGYEKPMNEKPTELCSNVTDKSNGVLDKSADKLAKEVKKVEEQNITNTATASRLDEVF